MTISELSAKSNETLKNAGIQSYLLDTQLLLSHFLKKDKLFILTNKDYEVKNTDEFFELVNKRSRFYPIKYILGKCEFMSLEFEVNEDVLIPRPDTEVLVERIIQFAKDKPMSMLEIGTGSGCISISAAHYCKNLKVCAVDISERALITAKKNAKNLNVSDRISFIKMDILNDFPKEEFDIVVSNPPYIESDEIEGLMPDVKNFEPLLALDGGSDGLDFYRRITMMANIRIGGMLAFEVGHTQANDVGELMKMYGYDEVYTDKDIQGIDRTVWVIKNERS